MKTSTKRYYEPIGYISPKLSFYEENYILEPEDYEADNGFFIYEGEIDSDSEEFYPIHRIAM